MKKVLNKVLVALKLKKPEPKWIVSLRRFRKKFKKSYKAAKKRGLFKKIFVVIVSLAFLATSVLPFVLSARSY